jgi:voltage-gated potassium channel
VPEKSYASIPAAVGIVNMALVGYGELPPQTDLGRFIASVMMLVG